MSIMACGRCDISDSVWEKPEGELAGVHRNTAATCFMRLRRLMASHLPGYRLSGETERTKAVPVESVKAGGEDARLEKSPYLVCRNAAARFMPQ